MLSRSDPPYSPTSEYPPEEEDVEEVREGVDEHDGAGESDEEEVEDTVGEGEGTGEGATMLKEDDSVVVVGVAAADIVRVEPPDNPSVDAVGKYESTPAAIASACGVGTAVEIPEPGMSA